MQLICLSINIIYIYIYIYIYICTVADKKFLFPFRDTLFTSLSVGIAVQFPFPVDGTHSAKHCRMAVTVHKVQIEGGYFGAQNGL